MRKRVLWIRVLAIATVILASCNKEVGVSFTNVENEAILQYAKTELTTFLDEEILLQASKAGIKQVAFHFQINSEFEEAAFKVDSKLKDDIITVELSGKTPSDALYAAYTFLEKGGYVFDITGPVKPQMFKWNSLTNYSEKIIPAVKKRGIRQHINFPMDVSAWSLEEAKSYIQNLSRMRFNYMTFHSYPGQWYEVVRKDTTEQAGHFFYGDVHLVPDQEEIKAIVGNKKYFCIPEIEPVFEDKTARGKMAVEWLQNVIGEAKRTGMQVQFSFEPRNAGTEIQKTLETAKAILEQYPMIDALELITEEAGGWGPRTTEAETRQTIVEHFGEEYLNDSIVMKPVKEAKSDLAYNYGQIGHNIKAINYLREHKLVDENLGLKLGIYVVIPEYAKPAYYLARQFAPETEIAIMPGHHSTRVDNNLPEIVRNEADWDKSIIYTWVELDGMMYIQQNGISGIQNTVKQATENSSDHRANAILFNHWRTAENKVTARYAAMSTLYGHVNPNRFYTEYAEGLGIKPYGDFALAMEKLNEADLTSIKNLSGFGFCWKGRWKNGGPVSHHPVEKLQEVRHAYERVLEQLAICSDSTRAAPGLSLLSLMDNRIRTTIIYIKAFEKARELKQFDTSNPLSEEDKSEYVRICNESMALFDQYIKVYAEINADRGCAGQLISMWHGPLKGVKVYRERNGGIPFDEEIPPETAVDEPPLPIINSDVIAN